MALSRRQKKFLKSQAQKLQPVVQIGKEGLHNKLISKISDELQTHELIKIKILDKDCIPVQEAIDTITSALDCELVDAIGKKIVVFCSNEENPDIRACGLHIEREELNRV